MTGTSILGLVVLNGLFLAVGTSVLFALRGFRAWSEAARLGGLAYMLGIASTATVLVWALVVGVPFSLATVLVSGGLVATIALVAAMRLGRRLPMRRRPSFPRPSLVTAIAAALVAVYSEALFRSGRLAALTEFDGWFFWVPKAKAIYYFGSLDPQFFRELPHPGYPPLVPVVEAVAFRFMGSTDVVTLHVQFWFLFVGFIAALVGLLVPRVPSLLLWPPLLLVLVTPHVMGYALQAQADFLLQELIAVSALLIALWLAERRDWQLVGATILLAAAMLSKREGYVFAGCVLLAGLATTWRETRTAWPRLVAVGVAAGAATLPWWILLRVRHLSPEGPEAGGIGLFSHLDLAWPSLRLTISTLFDYRQWLIVVPVALLAIAAAFAAGARRLPSYAALVYLLGAAGLTWTTWSFPSIPITKAPVNPIIRLTGWLILMTAAIVPLVLRDGWRAAGGSEQRE